MKRSRCITLTVLASVTVSLTACSNTQKTQRELYANQADCVEDWGIDDDCEPAGSGRYYGPHYYWNSGRAHRYSRHGGAAQQVVAGRFASLQQGSKSHLSTSSLAGSIRRGGFGSSSSSHSSGS